uniref:MFS transporter n=1 Tax=Heterorhabditis bacteriophora TaxID=37862 RepID=A0A1I7WBK1_HETBA
MEPRGLLSAYLQLSKSKLTMLITATAMNTGFVIIMGVELKDLNL